MAEYYATDDIYSEDGILLVSKGKKITNKAIQKLQRYENLQLKDLIVPANNRLNKQSKRLSKYTDHTIESFETRKIYVPVITWNEPAKY